MPYNGVARIATPAGMIANMRCSDTEAKSLPSASRVDAISMAGGGGADCLARVAALVETDGG